MKTHLPHGLRVALMAALAFVSLTPYAAVAGLTVWKDPSGGKSDTVTLTSSDYKYVYDPSGKATPLSVSISCSESFGGFNRSKASYLYVTTRSYGGDIYVTANNSPFGTTTGYSFVGVGGQVTLGGNLYIRSISTSGGYTVGGTMTAIDSGTVNKDAYLGLDDNSTHSGAVYLANGGTVQGTSTLEIASGTFNGTVAVGNSNANLGSGTNLIISGGTFGGTIVAGNTGAGTSTITGGTHTTISNGMFKTTVYGGSTNAGTTINNGVTVNITGGTFDSSRNVYALGSAGTVNGAVNLTIGNNAKFSGNNIISAGTDDSATYSGVTSSTVTLSGLTATGSLATNSTITVDGGQQKSVLVMDKVNATIQAKLSNFTSMKVTNGSKVTLTQALNETLGGAKSVTIAGDSSLALESADGKAWDLTVTTLDGAGSLSKTGEGKLTISGNSSTFNGNVNIGAGSLEVQNAMNAASLSGSGKLAKTGTGDMTVKDASGFKGNIEATGGTLQLEQVDLTGGKATQNVSVSGGATVNLVDMNQGTDGASIELSIDGGTFGVYADGQAVKDGNVGDLTLAAGGKIVIGKNSGTLEANLTTLEDSVLDFTAGVELTMGCTLDVKDGTIVLLNADDFDGLKDGTLESVTLFNGIDNTTMAASNLIICRGAEEGADRMTAQVDFQTDGEGHGTLSVKGVPEPTTGTLSLLALAGLCARRRRKH